MVFRAPTTDPKTDIAADAVLDAFDSAFRSGLSVVECYRAGIDAWKDLHPDHAGEYASKQAVEVILDAKVSLRIEE